MAQFMKNNHQYVNKHQYNSLKNLFLSLCYCLIRKKIFLSCKTDFCSLQMFVITHFDGMSFSPDWWKPEILPGRVRLWFAAFYELYDSVKFTKIQCFCIIVKDCSFFVEYQGDYFLGCEYKKNNSKRLNRHRTFSLYVLSLCGDFEA